MWICLAFAVYCSVDVFWLFFVVAHKYVGILCALFAEIVWWAVCRMQFVQSAQSAAENLLCSSHLLSSVECAEAVCWWMDVPLTTGGD